MRCRSMGGIGSVVVLMIMGALPALRATAQSDIAGLFAPWQDESRIESLNQAALENAGHTNSNYSLRLSSYESEGRIELMHQYPINPTIGYQAFYLDINSNSPRLPQRLFDGSVGFATPVAKFGDWFTAIAAGVGYAGDVPLSQGDAYYGRGDILVGREFGKGESLIIALDYNGNRAAFQDLPLPGFAYSKRINDEIGIVVGFPYSSITWESAVHHLRAKLDYEFPGSFAAEVSYPVTKHFHAYGDLRNILDGFHTDALPSDRRIFFEQQRLEAGIRWEPAKQFNVVVGGGWAFNTRFERGFDSRDTRRVEKGSDELYLRLGVEFRY